MKCPHCHEDLPFRECPECKKQTLMEGSFCAFCGAQLSETDLKATPADEESDFSNRVLCSDGTCIGVINEHGVCSECGKPYTGEGDV